MNKVLTMMKKVPVGLPSIQKLRHGILIKSTGTGT